MSEMEGRSARLEIEVAGGDTATPLNLRKRVALIEKYAGPLAGKEVIDCGCGGGEYVRALSQLGADVRGIEYSREKVDHADLPPELKGRVRVGDLQKMDFEDGRFDVALLNEVLEHVPDDRRGLQEVHRILKGGGLLILLSPCRLYPFETHGVYLRGTKRRVPHYTPFIPYVPIGVGRLVFDYWARNYWPWQLQRMVRQAGFEIVRCESVWQTFENISGHQPALIRVVRPQLRAVFSFLERVPGVRAFGVSQAVVAEKRA